MYELRSETNREARMLAGALNYAAADASDPFALGRAMCHIKMGICNGRPIDSEEYGIAAGADAHYSALPVPATVDGVITLVYHNRVRP